MTMSMKKFTLTAAGDMLIQRRIPDGYEGLSELADFIGQGDASFFNLESTINDGSGWGNQYNGGSYLRADPSVLDDAKKYGFNMMSFANNHSMDFCHWGLVQTIQAADASGIVHAGCGMSLEKAAAPAYLDLPQGRVALIAATSTMEAPAMAGSQSRYFIGRPGVNALRHDEMYELPPDLLNTVQMLADTTHINAWDDVYRREGYLPALPEGHVALGKHLMFREGEKVRRVSSANEQDMLRIERAIYEAQFQSDYIAVSIHSHEQPNTNKECPDDFLVEFCHRCIDAGADVVIGHGPHLLRPIEIYKGKPIFYSLGDFMLQNENIPYGPEDMYQMYNLTSDSTMRDLFAKRSHGFKQGLQSDHRAFETIIPMLEYENGKLVRLQLLPVDLGFGQHRSVSGLPRPCPSAPFMERLVEMSKAYQTQIVPCENGLYEVVLSD